MWGLSMTKWIFIGNEEIPETFLCKNCKHIKSIGGCLKMDLIKVKNWKKGYPILDKFKDNYKLFKCKKDYWIIIP